MPDPTTPAPPARPLDRAAQRMTESAPVEILRGPTTRRIVKGRRGQAPPATDDTPAETRSAVDDPDEWTRLQQHAEQYLTLPDVDEAEVRRAYKRDPKGRFSSGGGGAGAGGAKKAAPAGGSGEAGTGKVGKKMARQPKVDNPGDVAAQAKAANPKYLSSPYTGPVTPEIERAGGVSYSQNCTRVAMAYEMRRRGMDVTAGAATSAGDSTAAYTRAFRQDGKYAVRVEQDLSRSMSAREVAAEARSWPVGARGIVVMQGHTCNIERTESGVRFVDAQAGSRRSPVLTPAQFAARAESRGAPTDRHMAVTRVDDLDMSDYSLRYVESSTLDIADGSVFKTDYPFVPGSDRFPTDADLLAMTPDDTYP